MPDNQITLKTITELLGMNFYIPEYQRGYRWTGHNVTQLLDDVWEYRDGQANTFYCLQPVVVKNAGWMDANGIAIQGFELIDGQQRLTTIHRILTYLQLEHLKSNLIDEGYPQNLYKVYYKTRLDSAEFLNDSRYDASTPDLYYLSESYRTIKDWFENGVRGVPRQVKDKVLNVLLPSLVYNQNGELIPPEWSVKVIWYEISEDNSNREQQKSEELFKRLNRGKIPLTSAELIKAKFVNSQSLKDLNEYDQIKKKTELIQIWDEIETQLNDPQFWAFITNKNFEDYSSKIELLFDAITDKGENEIDPLYSFIHFFSATEDSNSLWEKWIKVEEVYRSLMYWYKDKNYYHKIGFLIELGTSINELIDLRKKCLKDQFNFEIDRKIAEKLPTDWQDLYYNVSGNLDKIGRILLLHNLEIMRKNENTQEFFPFKTYKNITKSIEHIHAQNIENIDPNNKSQWIAWLQEHLSVLPEKNDEISYESLKEKVKEKLPKLTFREFQSLSREILAAVPQETDNNDTYLHKIENLALLGLSENITLGNSVFEVKRRKILDKDKEREFIPIATKRIFLKYYASGNSEYSIWTKQERETYKKDIEETLSPYLKLNTLNLLDDEN